MKTPLTPVRAKWVVSSSAASNVDELYFTSRDAEGRICWWDVTPPKTNRWHVHAALGRAFAIDLLDLIHNGEKTEALYKHTFGFIASEIVRCGSTMDTGLYDGFFCTISEYLITGKVAK